MAVETCLLAQIASERLPRQPVFVSRAPLVNSSDAWSIWHEIAPAPQQQQHHHQHKHKLASTAAFSEQANAADRPPSLPVVSRR